jgi:16S rRNA (guanine966-N2)-methyltransferase
MRVVSGFLKGKKIDFLKSITTRPLRDFIKENIFNIIKHSNLTSVNLENANILDLYSGIGSFGIECISRGVKKVIFVENDINALTVLRKNLRNLKIENQTEVVNNKIIFFFEKLDNKDKFEIIFFDPPFVEDSFIEELKIIKNSKIYKKKHLIIIHREKKSKDNFSGIINILLTRTYNRSKIIFATF